VIPETVFGLPAHPLIVHAPVILVPLATLGVIAIVVVPRWRERYGSLVAILAVVAFLSTIAAYLSGENFEETFEGAGGSLGEKIEAHEALGKTMPWFGLGLAIVAVGFVLLVRRGAAKNVILVAAVVAVVVSGAATVQLIRTGHAGATAVFNPGG
jgi:hypothetical protein